MAPYTLHDGTILTARCAMLSLQNILTTASTSPTQHSLPTARLAPDMNPLSYQVHYATYQAITMARMLTEPISPSSSSTAPSADGADLDTLPKMLARVEEAIAALTKCDKEVVDGNAEVEVSYPTHKGEVKVPVKVVAERVYLSNVYFHVAMAYAVCRKEGVKVGKREWMRGWTGEYVT
jgi:uncharacterized protein